MTKNIPFDEIITEIVECKKDCMLRGNNYVKKNGPMYTEVIKDFDAEFSACVAALSKIKNM